MGPPRGQHLGAPVALEGRWRLGQDSGDSGKTEVTAHLPRRDQPGSAPRSLTRVPPRGPEGRNPVAQGWHQGWGPGQGSVPCGCRTQGPRSLLPLAGDHCGVQSRPRPSGPGHSPAPPPQSSRPASPSVSGPRAVMVIPRESRLVSLSESAG